MGLMEKTKPLCQKCKSTNLRQLGSFEEGKGLVAYKYDCQDCGYEGVSKRVLLEPRSRQGD